MPSTSPPLFRPPSCSTPCRIHWPAIFASASVSFALVAGVFAWIATHPHKVVPPPQASKLAAVELPLVLPLPPQAPAIAATPVLHHSPPREEISSNIPLMEENPPPLLPPPSPQSKEKLPLMPKKPAGETYGTQVLFLNNREAAADLARQEHKLLFVMHISGNFEDSCFT